MIIIKRNIVEKDLNEKSFLIQILQFIVTMKLRILKMTKILTQMNIFVDEF